MRATFSKIYINNLKHNLKLIRSKINQNAKMCVEVKADAYGHGAVKCAKICEECGVDFLAVATVKEGIELRENNIKSPILLLSLCNPSEYDDLVQNDLTPLIFDEEYILGINDSAKKFGKKNYAVHLAVDTGMGRIGCLPEEAGKIAKIVVSAGNLKFEGICTHFSVADSVDSDDEKYTKIQYERFLQAVENVKKEGINPGIRHCANSALTMNCPDMHLDMCRPGIIVYGYYPGDLKKNPSESYEDGLKPVMALVTKVVAIRDFDEGKSISYGRTFTTDKKTKIGVLPIGYADGLFRRFQNKDEPLEVVINGKKYPIRGRICMDQCMVDLGLDSDVQRWDEVVIFGPEESGAAVSAQEIADRTGTISYEITCGISKRVERIFV